MPIGCVLGEKRTEKRRKKLPSFGRNGEEERREGKKKQEKEVEWLAFWLNFDTENALES